MSATSDEYKPINCDFYDHIEILALRNHWIRLEYVHEGGSISEICKIRTTQTKNKIELIITEDEREIKMDCITSITPINPATDMRVNLLEKLAYNHWANLLLLQHLKNLPNYPSRISVKINHIINAHDIWNRRILQMNPRLTIWEESPQKEWEHLFHQVNSETKSILKQVKLERIIRYKNSKSELQQSTIADIIYHVINHGTYHRGQISDLLSSTGNMAVATDYILFSRTKHIEL